MRTKQILMLMLLVIVLSALLLIKASQFSTAANINSTNYKNVTVTTRVNITNSKPEVLNLVVFQENNVSSQNITLNAGNQRNITCNATIRDWNGYADLVNVNGTIWSLGSSQFNASDDNNTHYSNLNCTNTGNGVNFTVNYLCIFPVYYYANNGTWNCSVTATDTFNKTGTRINTTILYPLYALNVTDGIDYGNVAVEDTSLEKMANVTNFGNLPINLTLEGYGVTRGDGLAMNCSLNGNITVDNERYAITTGAFGAKTALTNSPQTVAGFTIPKQNVSNTPITNTTFWQLYIPPNPAGNCTGFVIFSAIAP